MKSLPFRVFIMVLTAGIIGIAGVLILKYNINKLSHNYQVIIEEHNENRIYMEQLSQLLYQHRSFIAIHVASKEEKDLIKYEEKEKQVRDKMYDGEQPGTTISQSLFRLLQLSSKRRRYTRPEPGRQHGDSHFLPHRADE